MSTTIKGTLIASAVMSLLSASAFADDGAAAKAKQTSKTVKCGGINSCKASGACAGADKACKAQNTCKGKGWVETKSAKECTTKGGKVVS